MVSKIGGQVVVWVTGGWHEISVLVEHRVPVVHVAAIKPIEIIEAEAIGPAVERTSGTGFPKRACCGSSRSTLSCTRSAEGLPRPSQYCGAAQLCNRHIR